MVKPLRRYDIYLVNLDPTQGSEIQKMWPCVVISPDEMNRYIRTVIIAPMTLTQRDYPSRVNITFSAEEGPSGPRPDQDRGQVSLGQAAGRPAGRTSTEGGGRVARNICLRQLTKNILR